MIVKQLQDLLTLPDTRWFTTWDESWRKYVPEDCQSCRGGAESPVMAWLDYEVPDMEALDRQTKDELVCAACLPTTLNRVLGRALALDTLVEVELSGWFCYYIGVPSSVMHTMGEHSLGVGI